jgi:hypothetical protein
MTGTGISVVGRKYSPVTLALSPSEQNMGAGTLTNTSAVPQLGFCNVKLDCGAAAGSCFAVAKPCTIPETVILPVPHVGRVCAATIGPEGPKERSTAARSEKPLIISIILARVPERIRQYSILSVIRRLFLELC